MARPRTQRLRGKARFVRLLRRLPDAVRGELIVELRVTGRQMRQAIQARAPKKSGRLIAGITDKVLPTSVRLQIGLLGTKAGRSKLFYGRIQDLGRREQVVRVTRGKDDSRTVAATKSRLRRRGPNKGTPIGSPYTMRVRGMTAKRFVTGRYPDLRNTLRMNLRGIFQRSLARISGGSDE